MQRSERTALQPAAPIAATSVERIGTRLLPLLLSITTFAVYALACGAEFTIWDDRRNIYRNALITSPTLQSLLSCWSHAFLGLYIPVTYSVWWVLATVSRVETPDPSGITLNPFAFHTCNVLCHIVVVLAVFQLLRRLVGAPWPAAAGALLFALHPVQVESVAWVTGLKDVLSGLLVVLALNCYLGSIMQRQPPARRRSLYALGTAAYVIAMLAKPQAIAGVFIAVALDWLVVQRPLRHALTTALPWVLLSLPIAAVTQVLQPVGGVADGGPLWARPFVAADTLVFYLYKVVAPVNLAIDYGRTPTAVMAHGWAYITWVVPAAVLAGIWAVRRRAPWAWGAAAVFLAYLIPVLGLVPFRFQQYSTVADRYLYLAMLGPALALAFTLRGITPTRAAPAYAVTGIVLAVLGILTFRQSLVWHNDLALFTNAVRVNPRSAVACLDLGNAYQDSGRDEEAAYWFGQGLQADARSYFLHANLALSSARLGHWVEAEREYAAADRLAPNTTPAQDLRMALDELRRRAPASGSAPGQR